MPSVLLAQLVQLGRLVPLVLLVQPARLGLPVLLALLVPLAQRARPELQVPSVLLGLLELQAQPVPLVRPAPQVLPHL